VKIGEMRVLVNRMPTRDELAAAELHGALLHCILDAKAARRLGLSRGWPGSWIARRNLWPSHNMAVYWHPRSSVVEQMRDYILARLRDGVRPIFERPPQPLELIELTIQIGEKVEAAPFKIELMVDGRTVEVASVEQLP
jgi:hypothetical protein